MDYAEQLRKTNETNHFMIHNNITATLLTEREAQVTAKITPVSLNAMESVHGGLMFIMAETAAGLLTRNDGRRHVTVNSSFQFLKGTNQAEQLVAKAVVMNRGRKICVCRSSVMEPGSDVVLAEGEFTFYCLDSNSR